MSEINVNTIKKADGTGSLTVPAESGTVVTTASPSLGRRNLIINGAMQVAQRGTSSTSGGYCTVDRFSINGVGLDDLTTTIEQSSDAPSGFSNSLKLTIDTPEVLVNTTERYEVRYLPEGQDLQHLAYGTADAKTVTVSFWVKSSVTGTYSWIIYQQDHPDRRAYSTSYTINSANTWEYKTMTVPGDTSGRIDNDTGNGFTIAWVLSAGTGFTGGTSDTWFPYVSDNSVWAADHAVDIAGTSGATWQITGVQLEVGSVATPFEHRSYGEELALCQRYYQVGNMQGSSFVGSGGNTIAGNWSLPVEMRSTPTVNTLSTTAAYYDIFRPSLGNGCNSVPTISNLSTTGSTVCLQLTPTGWQYTPAANDVWAGRNGEGTFSFDAEL